MPMGLPQHGDFRSLLQLLGALTDAVSSGTDKCISSSHAMDCGGFSLLEIQKNVDPTWIKPRFSIKKKFKISHDLSLFGCLCLVPIRTVLHAGALPWREVKDIQ